VQLPFKHRDLMPQHQDLGVFVPIAHRQQPQQRKGVCSTWLTHLSGDHLQHVGDGKTAAGLVHKSFTVTGCFGLPLGSLNGVADLPKVRMIVSGVRTVRVE